MPISQQGALNTTALVVPDLYVQIVPPQNLVLNGVPTNRIGVVGTASWGPVGTPAIAGSMADYARLFGAIRPRKYDMGTQVATAVLQGASDFRCVRVTDGTDVAASSVVLALAAGNQAMGLTARYTGSVGNSLTWQLAPGSAAGTWKFVIALPGQQPEVFDNLGAGLTGTAFWAACIAAINGGNGPLRGPSQLVVASAGIGAQASAAPSAASGNFGLGTDGAGVASTALVGVDTVPRAGMYALRGQGCGLGVLADLDDATQWSAAVAFGLSEGTYMILAGPAGDTISNAVATKATAGIDSYAAKLMFGDWLYWSDAVNGVVRLVSPQGFVAGRLGNLSPEQSSLNKPLYGVVGSQKSGVAGSGQAGVYSSAELTALFQAGLDVVCNPQPGGAYWGVRAGHNSSSNPATNGDNYTRLTNFIASTLAAGMGQFVGRPINADLLRQIRATQLAYLQNLLGQGILGSTDGSLPFGVVCDLSNNPASRTSLGYVQSDAQVQYQAINEKFICNVEGGQTVTVRRQTTPAGQLAA